VIEALVVDRIEAARRPMPTVTHPPAGTPAWQPWNAVARCCGIGVLRAPTDHPRASINLKRLQALADCRGQIDGRNGGAFDPLGQQLPRSVPSGPVARPPPPPPLPAAAVRT